MALRTTTLSSRNSKMLPLPAISYRLSDKHFLDVGWTAMPSETLPDSIVIMKAMLSNPSVSQWFKKRPTTVKQEYPDGKILSVAYPDGSGKIYYPNGKLAMKIDRGGIHNHRTRIWVYALEEKGRKPPKLCALFDSLGNGVVYDNLMNKRLVYNQREGILWDTPNGNPVSWKWHNIPITASLTSLNEDDEKSKIIDKPYRTISGGVVRQSDIRENINTEQNTATSQENFSEQEIQFLQRMELHRYLNTAKMLPISVSPLKPIVLKINKYLVLRVFSQSDIFLSFFTKTHRHKLKIGILYNPFDKLRAAHVENNFTVERVVCAFEALPAATKSMLRFKKLLQSTVRPAQ